MMRANILNNSKAMKYTKDVYYTYLHVSRRVYYTLLDLTNDPHVALLNYAVTWLARNLLTTSHLDSQCARVKGGGLTL